MSRRKPGQPSPEQAAADRLAADLENPASYFCSNPDCTQHVLHTGLDEAEFPRAEIGSKAVELVLYTSHKFVGPDGEMRRACDVCRSAIELVTGTMDGD